MLYYLAHCYVFGIFKKMNSLTYVILALFVFLFSLPLSSLLVSLKFDPGPWYYASVLCVEMVIIFGFGMHNFLLTRLLIHGDGNNRNLRRFFLFLDKDNFKISNFKEIDFLLPKKEDGFILAFSFINFTPKAWIEEKLIKSRVGTVAVKPPALGGSVNLEITVSLSGPYQVKEVASFLAKSYFDRGRLWTSYEQYIVAKFLEFMPGGLEKAYESAQDIFGETQPSAEEISEKFIELISANFKPELLSNVQGVEVVISNGDSEQIFDLNDYEICEQDQNDEED